MALILSTSSVWKFIRLLIRLCQHLCSAVLKGQRGEKRLLKSADRLFALNPSMPHLHTANFPAPERESEWKLSPGWLFIAENLTQFSSSATKCLNYPAALNPATRFASSAQQRERQSVVVGAVGEVCHFTA